ncbi:MAG: hypothetical protein GY761_00330 [Hyphomicrobiales bacterium]|nr:hypothetical protein [Hyphomicrobiales bacterium]
MQINVKPGLSGDLTSQVFNQVLDLAFVTSPSTQIPELIIEEIADESLYAIGDHSTVGKSELELLQSRPYISFSRRTWRGQQILARLQSRGIYVNEIVETNSLDAIERMVNEGFGISTVPQRTLAKSLSSGLAVCRTCTITVNKTGYWSDFSLIFVKYSRYSPQMIEIPDQYPVLFSITAQVRQPASDNVCALKSHQFNQTVFCKQAVPHQKSR